MKMQNPSPKKSKPYCYTQGVAVFIDSFDATSKISIVDHSLLGRKIAAEMLNQQVLYITYQLPKWPKLQQLLQKETKLITGAQDRSLPSGHPRGLQKKWLFFAGAMSKVVSVFCNSRDIFPLFEARFMESLRILGQAPFPCSVPKERRRHWLY